MLITLVLLGAIQGFILSIWLFFRKNEPKAPVFLALMVAILATNSLVNYLWTTQAFQSTPNFNNYFGFTHLMALGACLYLYVWKMLAIEDLKKPVWHYFIPVWVDILLRFMLFIAHFYVREGRYQTLETQHLVLTKYLTVFLFWAYLLATIRYFLSNKRGESQMDEVQKLTQTWVQNLLIGTTIFLIPWTVTILTADGFYQDENYNYYYPSELCLVIFIYWIGFMGVHRNQTHDTRSVTKTITATMLGIAIQEGHIKNADQTLGDFYDLTQYANYDTSKSKIELQDLLTMSSNFDGDDSEETSLGHEENMYPTKNWVDFTLSLPLTKKRKSGAEWHYFTAGVVVLGDILHQKVPNGLEKYTAEKLFRPLSINSFSWQFTPQKVVNTAGGLQLTPLDLAKLGQLYRNNGVWHNRQIVPKSWVETSLSRQKEIPFDGMGYGYLLWNRALKSNGKTYNTFNFLGNGGNRIVVMPKEAFTIVITASAYNTDYGHKQVDKILTDYVLPAIDGQK
jgi:CubicO group peptidase (beta-lactamase class C family)